MGRKRTQRHKRNPAATLRRLRPDRHHVVAIGAATIAVLTTIAYYPSLRGTFIFDDTALLVYNPVIKARDGLYRYWFTSQGIDYWPVFNSTLWLEWRLWGIDPTGYRVVNLLLHISTSVLLALTLERMGLGILAALFAALLFALHPVNVESVAWIAQLKNILALLFMLLALLSYLRSARDRADVWYWLSVPAFALAMLSKASAAVFPPLLILVLWWQRSLRGRDLVRMLPFLLIVAILVPVNVWFRARFSVGSAPTNLVDTFLGAGAAIWFYAYKALLPLHLSFLYPKWEIRADQWLWWLPILAAVAVTAGLWRVRDGRGRGLFVAWIFFVVALAPVLGLAGANLMEQFSVADHYQHLPVIAFCTLAATAWTRWHEGAPAATRYAAGALAAAVIAAFAILAWRQSALYVDPITLYGASLENSPDSALAHHNLGLAFRDVGRFREAQAHFEQAVKRKPDYDEAQFNLALELQRAGNLEGAIEHLETAVEIAHRWPDRESMFGWVPQDAVYRHELGAALAKAGHLEPAIDQLQKAVDRSPDYLEAYGTLGNALLESGRLREAIEKFQTAVHLEPERSSSQYDLGKAYLAAGEPQKAVDPLLLAVRLDGNVVAFHNDLGVALAQSGQREEAVAEFRAALRLDPNDSAARSNLDEVLAAERISSSSP